MLPNERQRGCELRIQRCVIGYLLGRHRRSRREAREHMTNCLRHLIRLYRAAGIPGEPANPNQFFRFVVEDFDLQSAFFIVNSLFSYFDWCPVFKNLSQSRSSAGRSGTVKSDR
jgi:hypothetical protein